MGKMGYGALEREQHFKTKGTSRTHKEISKKYVS
jgi:hypothetical protein